MKFCILAFVTLWVWFCGLATLAQAAQAAYEIDLDDSTVKIAVTWNTKETVLVMKPLFEEGHPLHGLKMKNKVQWQHEDKSYQSMIYDLDSGLQVLPEASVQILSSGTEQTLVVGAVSVERGESKNSILFIAIFVVLIFCSILLYRRKRRRVISIPAESFSRESAIQAIQRRNWSLLFEILSSDVPWKCDLQNLPWEDWQQQWLFGSRQISEKNCNLLIKALRDSAEITAENQSFKEEEEILETILTK